MAYRRRQGITRASTFKEEVGYSSPPPDDMSSSSSSSSSLAAQAIRASSAHRDSSLSSAYGESAFASAYRSPDPHRPRSFPATQDSTTYEYTSMKNLKETKYGFWSVLARRAKSILDDDNLVQQFNKPDRTGPKMLDSPSGNQMLPSYISPPDNSRKTSSPSLQKGLDAITSSLNYIGNAFEEGLTIVENRTADIVQETRKLHIRRKGNTSEIKPQAADFCSSGQQLQMQTDQETQLKASRDVAMAMAAKAKLLLRELKTVKADLAFAKERCAQLEEENRILRESRDKGVIPEDDDLIRLQLETLLAEKARLAHENSIYARENRFLREIVEYHQLTMQDVVYVDEGIEEVTEVCPISIPAARDTGHVANTQMPPSEISLLVSPAPIKDISVVPPPPPVMASIPSMAPSVSNGVPISSDRDMQLPAETSSMVNLPAMTDMSVVPLLPPVMASAPSLSPSVSGGAPISLDKNAQLSSTSSA